MKLKKLSYKNKVMLSLLLVIVVVYAVRFYQHSKTHSGATLESRKTIVAEAEDGLRILEEIRVDDYVISGVYNADGDYGFAIFKPQGKDKYELDDVQLTKADAPVAKGIMVTNEKGYDLFWTNIETPDHMELTYKDASGKAMGDSITLDAKDASILYHDAPNEGYEVQAIYYDTDGNIYE